jgi:3-oxoacyl-[acyl-carrier-protein] synthase-1
VSPPPARERVFITGRAAICAAGRRVEDVWDAASAGRPAIGPIRSWNASGWPAALAGEVLDVAPVDLVEDRKLLKLIGRGDVLGLHAARCAAESSGVLAHRSGLDAEAAAAFNERTGVFTGSSGGEYRSQHDFFPIMAASGGDLFEIGRGLAENISPLWLLRVLPNNVLCHSGVRLGFKGTNACITNHGASGALALAEAACALRAGEADRALAVGHAAPIEPQTIHYYHGAGLLAREALRPFDAGRDGTILGEGAAAAVLETESSAGSRGARPLGELLGTGCSGEAGGIFPVREDGDGVERAVLLALEEAGILPREIGMVVAHGNGGRGSDASEAAALRRVLGPRLPPVTAFKWVFGHLIDAAGVIDALLALESLRRGVVPPIATLREVDPALGDFPAAREPARPSSDLALVVSRGFGGISVALVLGGLPGGAAWR